MIAGFPATRAAGLARLAAFAPGMGQAYATQRNTDLGPDSPTTSLLSPYLRRRLVLEQETVARARAAHGPDADKFVREVIWRGYFKGYLELRPFLWAQALRLAAEAEARLAQDAALRRRYAAAVTGATGIDGFDDWARDLTARNWLHNHTRMWFASIWIFTLDLPWTLGAAFFLRHLIDGDPASNTLSWRWVAGLHTRGKHYVARAENIRRFTEGRYAPRGLNENPAPLTETPLPVAKAPPPEGCAPPAGEVALLLHLDDLHPESLDVGGARVVCVHPILAHAEGAADAVIAADRAAMDDAVARACAHFGCGVAPPPPDMRVVAAWAPCGPSAEALPPCHRILRPWDAALWPHCGGGYHALARQVAAVG